MRTIFGLALASAALVCGCGPDKSSETPANAPSGYAGALIKGQQVAEKGIDTASLNQAVQLFNAQEGRNPKDLNELVAQHYLGALPQPPAGMKLSYDPASGKVSVIPQ